MNSSFLCGIIFVAVVAVCYGELCTPDQWEGVEVANGGYVYMRRPGYIEEYGYYSYDAENMRTAKTVHYDNNGKKTKFQVIIRFENEEDGYVYVVDKEKEKCWKKKMPHEFKKICIPDSARKVDAYSIGLKDGGLKVTGYVVEGEKSSAYVAVATAGDHIIPVYERVRGHYRKAAFSENIQFADIVPGIKDPSVFEVPEICDEETESPITEYMLREHFILAL